MILRLKPKISILAGRPAAIAGLVAMSQALWAVSDDDAGGGETATQSEAEILSSIQYPSDVKAEVFAQAPDIMNGTALSFDEQNRIFVSETYRFDRGIEDNRRNLHWVRDDIALETTEDRLAMYQKHAAVRPMERYTRYADKVRVMEDRDGDGRSDFSRIFADGFNDPLDGTAAGVLAANGKVYFACIPNVWMLEDRDGDLVAEKRQSLQNGFGISTSLSGHDLNGFAFGPDGRIYFTIGDRGYNFTTKEGRHYKGLNSGAVFRMEPDGSEVEVVHAGLRNPKEIAFDKYGHAFTVDNNADMGDKARVVYIVEGGDSGWHRGNQNLKNFREYIDVAARHQPNWMGEGHWDRFGENRPAALLPASAHVANGPSGLTYYPGIGFNARYDNHFFICDYKGARSAVLAVEMEESGGGYALKNEERFIEGLLNTDAEFGYDGKLYVIDFTGSWKTYDMGAMLTFHDPVEIAKPVVAEVKALFANGFEGRSDRELYSLLGHADMRVRMRAQFELAKDPGNAPLFVEATRRGGDELLRLHGVWGLGQLARYYGNEKAIDRLIELCSDADRRVRGQAAQVLGDAQAGEALKALIALTNDDHPNTRMLAGIALGKLKSPKGVSALLTMLKANDDEDAYVRHGAVEGLLRIGNVSAMLELADYDSAAVRRGLVLALRRAGDARIAAFLEDEDESIVVEAIQAINDCYIEGARPALAESMTLLGEVSPEIDYRLINAGFRNGTPADALRLLGFASDDSLPEHVRIESVFALGRWESPPAADPTTGQHRPLANARDLSSVREALAEGLAALLEDASGELLAEAMRVGRFFGVKSDPKTLIAHLENLENATEARLAALSSLVEQGYPGVETLVEGLIYDPDLRVRQRAYTELARLNAAKSIEKLKQTLASGELRDQQHAYALLARLEHPEVEGMLLGKLKTLDRQPEVLWLDILEACSQRPETSIGQALAAYNAALDANDPLAAYRAALAGGDSERGKDLFYNHGAAQCSRCHMAEKKLPGGDAGPDLWGIGKRQSPEYFLESLLDPNAKLAVGYSMVSVTLKNGATVGGLLVEESDAAVSIKNVATQETTRYPRSEIKSMPAGLSTMPPMGMMLQKKDLRDIVAYLSQLGK